MDEGTRLATKRQEAREAAARAQREHRERKTSGAARPPIKLPNFESGAAGKPPSAPGAAMSDGNGIHTTPALLTSSVHVEYMSGLIAHLLLQVPGLLVVLLEQTLEVA